jgi:hypothetical protein
MARTKTTEKATTKEYYTPCYGLGAGRLQLVKRLNNAEQVEVKLVPKNDKIEVFMTDGNKVGTIMSGEEPAFELVKKKESAINTILSAEELLPKLQGETTALAVSASSVSVIKIRVELDDSPEAATAKQVVDEPEFTIDTSSFAKNDEEEVKVRINYLKKTLKMPVKIRNNIIAAFVSFMSTHKDIVHFEPTFINNNGIMETAVKNILCGNNLALTGPKGVGKNVLVEHLSSLFDLPLCDMQMSYDTAKEEVRGEPTFMEDGSIGVRLSNLVDAAQKPSLINLDEVNMARGSITSLLHSLTDHRRYIEIPGYGMVRVHPQARFTITMNEGDEYEGTRQLNVAFRDRFHEIVFKPNPEGMKAVFMSKCNLSEEDAIALAKYYKLIHSAVYNTDSDSAIPDDYLSQRKFVRAGQMYSNGFASTIEEAFREEVIETIADDEIKGILENLILVNCK